MKKTIKKAKLQEAGMYIEYQTENVINKEGSKPEVLKSVDSKECKWKPHDDLQKAYGALRIHMALITEQESDFDLPEEKLEKYVVTAINRGDLDKDEEQHGVTIVGYRKLKTGYVLNMVTQFTKFSNEEEGAYEHGEELAEAVNTLEQEVLLYMNGKRTLPAQMELEFDNAEVHMLNV